MVIESFGTTATQSSRVVHPECFAALSQREGAGEVPAERGWLGELASAQRGNRERPADASGRLSPVNVGAVRGREVRRNSSTSRRCPDSTLGKFRQRGDT